MERYLKFLLFACFVTQGSLFAQGKMGYANASYIISLLPETKVVETDLQSYEKQLKNRLKDKYEEFQAKGMDLQQNFERMTDLERADKQKDLQTLEESIIRFEQEANVSLQNKNEELMDPLLERVQNAIDAVAKRENYRYVFKSESLLYASETEDITSLVLKELNIMPPPTTE